MSVLLPWLAKEAANCMNGLGEELLGGEKANCPPAWAGNSKSLASCKSRGSGTMDLPWSKTETLLGPRTRITHVLYILCVLWVYPSFDAPQVPTLLGVFASVCTPLPTRMQQLPTLLAQHCWELIIASVCTPLPTRMQQLPTLLAAQFCELMRPFARSLRTVESYHSKINNLAMFILNRITFAPARKPYRKRFIFTHHGTVISARFLLR